MTQLISYNTRISPVCKAITSLDAQYCLSLPDRCIHTITSIYGGWILGQDRPEKFPPWWETTSNIIGINSQSCGYYRLFKEL